MDEVQPAPQEDKPRRTRRDPEPGSQPGDTPQAKPKEVRVRQLIEGATGLLGTSRWAAAGALHDHDPDEKMTIDAAKAEVEKWLKQPVETAQEE